MWDAIKDFTFWAIDALHNISGDWGMGIILVTVIFRIIITPLMYKQTKSSYKMQKVQPLIKEIQQKYADDKVRLQEETQKIYAEAKFNPITGCLPMILQMPIFIALFQVLNEMPERMANQHLADTGYGFYNIITSLVVRPSEALEQGFGIFLPYGILLIIFAGATFIPMILQQRGSKNPQKKQTIIMSVGMSVFMLFIGWGAPAGVLLFWGASSVIAIIQQQISLVIIKRKEAEEEEAIEIKPIEVDVTRKAKKPRPTKKK